MANGIVVDPNGAEVPTRKEPASELATWVMSRVKQWRDIRDNAYKARWDDYYRTWRGRWEPEEKQAMALVGQVRAKQRSKLISPISSMAVDLTVSEIVEAIFGRERFIDVPDDVADPEKDDLMAAHDLLIEDLYRDGIIGCISEIVLNGAMYGTGIGKVNVDVEDVSRPMVTHDTTPGEGDQPPQRTRKLVKGTRTRVRVYPSPIEPGQFVPDPTAASIEDMLGCAHEFKMPLHRVRARQKARTYRMVSVGAYNRGDGTENRSEGDMGHSPNQAEYAFITEYHGLVPTRLLAAARLEEPGMLDSLILHELDEYDMTEAIVTVANEGLLLRGIPNPAIADDRAIDSYQHDQVPNRFWGRGVMEKNFHPQKALDAELRARVDSLAWTSNPMLAGDVTKMPPKMNLDVWPGKFWPVKGAPPKEVLQEYRFGDIGQSSFAHAESLERMSQQATGALDSIMSIRGNVRDETATGSAMSASGFLKRAKRTMFNIEGFLDRLIRKILWRKMQFEPDRYPEDFEFVVKGAIGIMAREVETAQMAQSLQYFPEEGSPVRLAITRALFEHSASPAKAGILKAIDAQLKPNPEAEQRAKQMQDLQMRTAMAELNKTQAQTALLISQGDKAKAEALLAKIEASYKDDEIFVEHLRAAMDQQEIENQAEQNRISREKLQVERQKIAADAHNKYEDRKVKSSKGSK